MRRALFVTAVLPAEIPTRGSGIHARFEMLIESVARVVDHIDFLIFVDHRLDGATHDALAASHQVLQRKLDKPYSLRLVPVAPPRPPGSLFARYVLSARSLAQLPDYRAYAGPAQVAALREALREPPALLFLQRLACAVPWLELADSRPAVPTVLDLDDVEHVAYRRAIGQPPRWRSKSLAYLHLPALVLGEYRAARRARATLVCSSTDRRKLCRLFGDQGFVEMPNSVNLPAATAPARAPHLMFVGVYSYPPNRVAAEFFLDHIWPLIRAAVPAAECRLVGARPESVRHHDAPPPGVSFTGYLANLGAAYETTRIVVCPVLSGGGTRVKIVEAAAHGRPVVSTSIGAEGLDFDDGVNVVLRDRAEHFAAACIELLGDYPRCVRIGDAARHRVSQNYERGALVERLAGMLDGMLGQ